jgi:protein-disulfide isomerase
MQPLRPILVVLAAALLVAAASAQDLQLITPEGQKEMLQNPGTEIVGAGAHKADVTIVEYFDYNCPFCKKLVPALKGLLAQDPKVAVLYKEWPILGDVSVYAATAALAAGYQGKYLAAHDALITGPRLSSNDQVDEVLKGAGVKLSVLNKDRASHAKEIAALLERNDEEAQALNLRGTPGIVVGRQLLPGITDLDHLKQLVAASRKGQ